jgi:A/G-specific adenine glycosylase
MENFNRVVLQHYSEHARELPWRHTRDPYAILVSEVMLQQTQVARVLPKYETFLAAFPTAAALASASTASVLSVWQGLGYNRRALALQRAAGLMVSNHCGRVPRSAAELCALPSIGWATAAAICVYAYGQPLAFIETNIRAAFIHFFFQECSSVSDAELLPLVELALDRENPRDWYYALMDYGAWIKRTGPNPGRKSRHHAQGPPFAGPQREARGAILRLLLSAGPSGVALSELWALPPLSLRREDEVASILRQMAQEGFLVDRDGTYFII